MVMTKRLGALFLLVVLAGGAFAGVPFRYGETGCGMHDMMGMDCCQAALQGQETPEVANAKLCCALVCGQSGTTSPPAPSRIKPAPSASALVQLSISGTHQALIPPHKVFDRLHGPPGSPPAYLKNLTLLI